MVDAHTAVAAAANIQLKRAEQRPSIKTFCTNANGSHSCTLLKTL